MDSSERLRLVINSCNVPLVIDKRTIGDGNCFPRGIVQQLQRREVKRWMTVNKPIAYTPSHVNLRKNVVLFALSEQKSETIKVKL